MQDMLTRGCPYYWINGGGNDQEHAWKSKKVDGRCGREPGNPSADFV
jgi:hypothetical protein